MGNSNETGTYGAKTSALQAVNNKDLSTDVIVVTGSNTGLGKETAKVLLRQGATVVMACRSTERGENALKDIITELTKDKTFSGKVEEVETRATIMKLDLGSLQSVYDFSKEFNTKYEKLNYLINNAGIMALPAYKETHDGFEMQWGVNHLGHSYLTNLLTPILIESKPSRVIQLTSDGHNLSPNPISDILKSMIENKNGPTKETYNDWLNYGISKGSNLLFAREFNQRYSSQGVTAYSVHPGVIQTDLSRNSGMWSSIKIFSKNLQWLKMMKNVTQGAATTVRLVGASDEELKESGGHYWCDCNDNETIIRDDYKETKVLNELNSKYFDLTNVIIKTKGLPLTLKEENENESKENINENEIENQNKITEIEKEIVTETETEEVKEEPQSEPKPEEQVEEQTEEEKPPEELPEEPQQEEEQQEEEVVVEEEEAEAQQVEEAVEEEVNTEEPMANEEENEEENENEES